MASRHRPRRGPNPDPDSDRNVLIEGDTGIFGGPQGGAEPGASESGDLHARQFGVPQADVPGGLNHLINTQTKPAPTVDKGERPADYHKYHGVPPTEPGQYVTPPKDVGKAPRPAPVRKSEFDEAVPVRIIEGERVKSIRILVTEGPVAIPAGTVDPIRVAERDPNRSKFWICNETTPSAAGAATPGVRIGDFETTADLRGLLIPAAQIKDFNGQDTIYITNQSGTAVTVSWGYETEMPEAGI